MEEERLVVLRMLEAGDDDPFSIDVQDDEEGERVQIHFG
jgi:hypothetical protein